MIKTTLHLLFSFLLLQTGTSQSAILSKYIEEGLANNLSLRGVDLEVMIQESSFHQAKKLWSPRIDLNGSYLLATGGRTIVFPVGDLFNPTYATLNQLTGTEQFPTDLENFESQLTPNNFVDFQINATKPLINSAIKYNQKIQAELIKLQHLNKEVIEQDIVLQIKTAYYNYLKSFEGLATIDASIKTLNELLKFNKVLVKYSKATKDIISDVDYRISNLESEKTRILEQQKIAKAYLNLLINKPLDGAIRIDQEIINTHYTFDREINDLNSIAREQRTEVKKLQLAEGINELNKTRIIKEKNPVVGIFAGIGVQTENFNFDAGGALYTTGINLKMNILDGGLRQKKVEQLQYEKEKLFNDKAQLFQKIDLDITKLYYQIKTIESQIKSQQSAKLSAQQSFDILKTQYENDKILLIQLLQAQNRLTTSAIGVDILKYDHLIKLAELDKVLAAKN